MALYGQPYININIYKNVYKYVRQSQIALDCPDEVFTHALVRAQTYVHVLTSLLVNSPSVKFHPVNSPASPPGN